jgi:hypothetical protein
VAERDDDEGPPGGVERRRERDPTVSQYRAILNELDRVNRESEARDRELEKRILERLNYIERIERQISEVSVQLLEAAERITTREDRDGQLWRILVLLALALSIGSGTFGLYHAGLEAHESSTRVHGMLEQQINVLERRVDALQGR